MDTRERSPATEWSERLSSLPAICLLLALVTLVVWWPVVHCDFVNYDDPGYFSENPHVLGGLSWANAVWAFSTADAGNWHPLTWLSLMLDAELFGPGPMGPHSVNLLLHTANTLLVFLLLRRMTMATWRSALVAALFALHPLHVESVAWVSERKDVLSAFFGLLALLAYARYADKFKTGTPSSKAFYCLALVFFALGLMSKPMLVTLPLVMLLLDWWPLQRFNISMLPRLLIEKIPFFALAAASCVVTFIVQQKGGAVATLARYSVSVRIENAFISYARYLGKAFWPATLANPYPHPEFWPMGLVLSAVVLFAGLCVATVHLRKRFPYALTGWFWFAVMLVPVIGLVQVGGQAMADRYAYLPLIGVFIVLSWGFAEVQLWRPIAGRKLAVLVAVLLSACAALTEKQISFWQNDGALFLHALKTTKNNYVACVNLGTWFSKTGQIEETLDCYYRALKMNPRDPSVLYDVANAFAKIGHWDEAISNYRRALQFTKPQPDILDNLGLALTATKQYGEAITNFEASLNLKPDSANAHNNLATVLFIEHRYEEAAQQYREALRLTSDDSRIYTNLGDTLVRLKQFSEARKCYQQALELDPANTSIEVRLKTLDAEAPK
jgi:Tfp pilus assembly protein PilF